GVSIGGGTSWEPVVAGDYKTYSPSNVYQTTHEFSGAIALPNGVNADDVASFQYKMNATFEVVWYTLLGE
ncbi:MAG: hypothetical protein AAFU65_03805, partial [Pseudomonadota bacterium]